MTVEEWEALRVDYHERMRIEKEEGIKFEQEKLDGIFKRLEVYDLDALVEKQEVPIDVFIMADVSSDGQYKLISRKWNEPLCDLMDMFKYASEAKERLAFYQANDYLNKDSEERYKLWLDYLNEKKLLTGETFNTIVVEVEEIKPLEVSEQTQEKLKEKANNLYIPKEDVTKKKKKVSGEGDDEDDDEDELTEEDIQNIRKEDEDLKLDDEIDDTYGEIPDGYIIGDTSTVEEKKEDDGWLF
jgi:hypothetical protein